MPLAEQRRLFVQRRRSLIVAIQAAQDTIRPRRIPTLR